MTPLSGRPLLFRGLCLLLTFGGVLPASTPARTFDIPAGDAEKMLQRFAVQSGEEILFSTDAAKGIRTHVVKGAFATCEAFWRMRSGTPLYLAASCASRGPPTPNAPRAA